MHTPPQKGKGHLTHTALLVVAKYSDLLIYKQAMNSDNVNEWYDACQYEMDTLAKNGMWNSWTYHQAIRPLNLNGSLSGKLMDASACT